MPEGAQPTWGITRLGVTMVLSTVVWHWLLKQKVWINMNQKLKREWVSRPNYQFTRNIGTELGNDAIGTQSTKSGIWNPLKEKYPVSLINIL